MVLKPLKMKELLATGYGVVSVEILMVSVKTLKAVAVVFSF